MAVKGINGTPGQEGRWIARVDLGGFDAMLQQIRTPPAQIEDIEQELRIRVGAAS